MAKKASTKLSDEQKRKHAQGYMKALDAGKRNYRKADGFLEALLEGGMKAGDKIEIGNNQAVTLVDQFAEKNASYKNVRVGRYQLEISYID